MVYTVYQQQTTPAVSKKVADIRQLTPTPPTPGQNGRYFAGHIFKCIFMNEKFHISIRISVKFVPMGLIDNNSALVQVMVWRRTGNKPLHESMLPQFTDTYMRHSGRWVIKQTWE